jgi:hypothetical protein
LWACDFGYGWGVACLVIDVNASKSWWWWWKRQLISCYTITYWNQCSSNPWWK